MHQRFGFRSSYNLRTPEQLLPHHPKLSANIPLSSVNPFNGFYWDVKQSLLVIDSLESVIGYHENMKRYVSSGFETKDINTNMVKTGYGISRYCLLKLFYINLDLLELVLVFY